MGSVYWRLLCELEKKKFNILGPTLTRLSKGQKLRLILRAWCRQWTGAALPNYGAP